MANQQDEHHVESKPMNTDEAENLVLLFRWQSL